MRNRHWRALILVLLTISCAEEVTASRDTVDPSALSDASGASDVGPRGDLSEAGSPRTGAGNGWITLPVPDAASGAPGVGEACAADTRTAETLPLDIVIMMDQSESMGTTVAGGVQWDLVVQALTKFVTDPRSDGIGVSIQYFGIDGGGFNWFGLSDTTSCNVATYANPDVPMTLLPAGSSALVDSLHRHGPSGMTPTNPALLGALTYAYDWAMKNPTHHVVVLLATDGVPSDCDSTVDVVAASAQRSAQGSPKILTYVIGVGPNVSSLDAVAAAGGTGKAFLVDTSQNTTDQFLAAVNAVRTSAIACQFSIPSPKPGEALDYGKINVAYTPGAGQNSGKQVTIPQVSDATACDTAQGGWYYDQPKAPTTVNLCEATCREVTADTAGKVETLVGCKTVTIIR